MDTRTLPKFVWLDYRNLAGRPLGQILFYIVTKAWPKRPKGGYGKALGVPSSTWKRWQAFGPIPHLKKGKSVLVRVPALFDSQINAAGRWVWLGLSTFSRDSDRIVGENWLSSKGTCFPTVGKIAERIGKSRQYVQEGLACLDALGWITRKRYFKRSSTFTLHYDEPVQKVAHFPDNKRAEMTTIKSPKRRQYKGHFADTYLKGNSNPVTNNWNQREDALSLDFDCDSDEEFSSCEKSALQYLGIEVNPCLGRRQNSRPYEREEV